MSYLQTSLSPTLGSGRSIGLLLVILLHVALVIAVMNGLKIRVAPDPIPTRVTVFTPDRPAPPEPVVPPVNIPLHNTWTISQPAAPNVPVEVTDASPPAIENPPAAIASGLGGATTTVAARVDPRHPLTQPAYPPQARRAGEHGTVELMLYVLANGRIGEAKIARSSGFTRLDEAALREARRSWRLLPAEENGMAVAGWTRIAITFRLTD